MANTSMLHVRVDDKLKAEAAATLADFGLTVSDAVRMLLTRVSKEGQLPVGLTMDVDSHDAWFRKKVQEALAAPYETIHHEEVMSDLQALIDSKSRA